MPEKNIEFRIKQILSMQKGGKFLIAKANESIENLKKNIYDEKICSEDPIKDFAFVYYGGAKYFSAQTTFKQLYEKSKKNIGGLIFVGDLNGAFNSFSTGFLNAPMMVDIKKGCLKFPIHKLFFFEGLYAPRTIFKLYEGPLIVDCCSLDKNIKNSSWLNHNVSNIKPLTIYLGMDEIEKNLKKQNYLETYREIILKNYKDMASVKPK